ncbi:hemolysin family protein [Consotaella salsifontis]|uniref:CBS domain-containing protein n=1 Tax=Consotaella salsifontis TaxID=1365950 RepID=A0A1T4S5F4_9HYPH|nr:hemolysin family protein [Consotaella salsifontis]SKA23519.1 CBS domain-containing protein [Consotaella salsifontis]
MNQAETNGASLRTDAPAEAAEGDLSPDRSRSDGAGEAHAEGGLLKRLLGGLRPKVPSLLRQDLEDALLDHGEDQGAFSPTERAMLNNILRLRELKVEDVMIPRADIEAVEITITLGDLMKQFESSGRSRMPVYGESLDDPRGMIHIRDILAHLTRQARESKADALRRGAASRPLAKELDLTRVDLSRTVGNLGIIRDLLYVPPSMLASDLMAKMQSTRTQMALVIDEYGGTDGLVSLEDILEMVVGDIGDEHDDDEIMITESGDGIYYAAGRADLEDVCAAIGKDFDISEYEDEADTVGGLLFSELGRVPARGEVVQAVPGFEFQVLDADPRRVRRVRIVRIRQGDRRRRIVQGLAETS